MKREMRERKKSDDGTAHPSRSYPLTLTDLSLTLTPPVLRRNIAKLQSEYRAEGLLRDYQDKRELYDKTPRCHR